MAVIFWHGKQADFSAVFKEGRTNFHLRGMRFYVKL